MRYRSLLHNYKKNDLLMSDYLVGIKHLCDSLASYSQQVLLEEQQFVVLNSLPPEYDHMISIITTSRVPFDLQWISMALLDAEVRHQAHSSQGIFLATLATKSKASMVAPMDLP